MRLRKRHLPFLAVLAIVAGIAPTAADSTTIEASITAVDGGIYEHSWQANGLVPAEVAILPGNSVSFSYPTGTNYHYPIFKGGPSSASCSGLPTSFSEARPGWTGSCSFTTAGTYEFWCGVHGEAMKAFVYVSSDGKRSPLTSTGQASQVSETGATLSGSVNPHVQATTWFFNYGPTISYGHTTSVQSAGEANGSGPVSTAITGLTNGTVYHFRLVAHNATGDAPGPDRTFTTTSSSPPPPPPPPPPGEETPPPGEETPPAGEPSPPANPPSTSTTATSPAVSPPVPAPPATVASATPSPSPASSLGASPLAGSTLSAIKVPGTQHGSTIHGSLDISFAGVGARLEVDLLAGSASLARKHSRQVRIGRLVRSSLAAGMVSFSAPLNAQAKRALRRHGHVPVVVQITLTPLHGAPLTTTRSVTLRR